jgi:hypothetical protein
MVRMDLLLELVVLLAVFITLLAIPHKRRHAHARSMHRHAGLRHVKHAA